MELQNRKIQEIWKKSKYQKPSILYATDQNNKIYYIARDNKSIVTLVVSYDKKVYTYMIPKKYLSIETQNNHSHYIINDTSKMTIISCSGKQIDKLANFIASNIINKL